MRYDYVAWLTLVLCWGISYPMIKLATEGFTPIGIVAFRLSIATVILCISIKLAGRRIADIWQYRWFCLSAGIIWNFLPFYLLGFGEQFTEASVAGLIMGITPIMAMILTAFFISEERITNWLIIATIFGFGAIAVLSGKDALSEFSMTQIGQFAVFMAAICYAVSTVITRKFGAGDPLLLATGSMAFGSILTWVLVLGTGSPLFFQPEMESIFSVLYLGIFASAFANLIFFWLMPRIGAHKMALVNFGVPIVAAISAVMFLGEPLTWRLIVAAICMCCALYFGLIKHKNAPAKQGRDR